MARKLVAPKLDPRMVEYGKQFQPGSPERGAWDRYVKASAIVDASRLRLENPKFDKPSKLSDKLVAELKEIEADHDQKVRSMFQQFDAFNRTVKMTIHVPEDEIRQVILGALQANADAMPGWADARNGLDVHREAKLMAQDILDELKRERVKVVEDETTDIPFCDDCTAEIG